MEEDEKKEYGEPNNITNDQDGEGQQPLDHPII